jgi:hypothetical protein
MSAWRGDNRVSKCRTAELLWSSSRVINGVSWNWLAEERCYQTHQWTRDNFYKDVRNWPAATPLASLLRAVREDERLDDPLIRIIALHIACEYTEALLAESGYRE